MAHFELLVTVSWSGDKKLVKQLEKKLQEGSYETEEPLEYSKGSVSFETLWRNRSHNSLASIEEIVGDFIDLDFHVVYSVYEERPEVADGCGSAIIHKGYIVYYDDCLYTWDSMERRYAKEQGWEIEEDEDGSKIVYRPGESGREEVDSAELNSLAFEQGYWQKDHDAKNPDWEKRLKTIKEKLGGRSPGHHVATSFFDKFRPVGLKEESDPIPGSTALYIRFDAVGLKEDIDSMWEYLKGDNDLGVALEGAHQGVEAGIWEYTYASIAPSPAEEIDLDGFFARFPRLVIFVSLLGGEEFGYWHGFGGNCVGHEMYEYEGEGWWNYELVEDYRESWLSNLGGGEEDEGGEAIPPLPAEFWEDASRVGAAVALNGSALRWVPAELKTAELCRAAVTKDGSALKWVPEELKTVELCRAALMQDGRALEFVPEKLKTAELCRAAVQERAEQFWISDPFGSIEELIPQNFKAQVKKLFESGK